MSEENNRSVPQAVDVDTSYNAPQAYFPPSAALAPESISPASAPAEAVLLTSPVNVAPIEKQPLSYKPERHALLDGSEKPKKRRILGMSTFVFSCFATIVILAVALGAGLGAGLKHHSHNSFGNTGGGASVPTSISSGNTATVPTSTTSSAVAPTATATSTSAASAVTSTSTATSQPIIGNAYCIEPENIIGNPRFENDLEDWTRTLNGVTNLASDWESSDEGAFLPILPDGNAQNLIPGISQQMELAPTQQYRVFMTMYFNTSNTEQPNNNETNHMFWVIMKQASNQTNEMDLLNLTSSTLAPSFINNLLSFDSTFSSFDDGATMAFIYAYSVITNITVVSLTVSPVHEESSSDACEDWWNNVYGS
ncbi:hypothetical protein V1512DRAFT_265913 [Lipomyces arxii]|uniref:uncharacterized protein n=1 Tax=Lipomyces arxii TaxID=56418 RepID=UPI0034CD883A